MDKVFEISMENSGFAKIWTVSYDSSKVSWASVEPLIKAAIEKLAK